MIGTYLLRCISFSVQKSLRGADALSILAALVIPSWYWWKDKPIPENAPGFYSFCILAVLAAFILVRLITAPYFLWKKDQHTISEIRKEIEILKGKKLERARRAILRLKCSGKSETAHEIYQENILNWYSFFTREIRLGSVGGEDVPESGIHFPPDWLFILRFEFPVEYRQVIVHFDCANAPSYLVHQQTQDSVLVWVNGPLPSCEMEIRTSS